MLSTPALIASLALSLAPQTFSGGGPPVPPIDDIVPPNASQANDLLFASDIAIAPSILAIGAPQADGFFATGPGAAFSFVEQTDGQFVGTELTLPAEVTGQLGARFGDSVAAETMGSTSMVAVGAPGTDFASGTNPTDAGIAYIFQGTGGAVTLTDTLTPFVSNANEEFGASVSLRGTSAVVGAPATSSSTSSGCVVPFEQMGGAFVQNQGDLLPSGAAPLGARFGSATAIDGNLLAVGAPGDNSASGIQTGVVYLYERTGPGAAWTGLPFPAGQVVGTQVQFGDIFGSAIGLSGDLLVVGAPFADDVGCVGCLSSGAVYVFERTGGPGSGFVQTDQLAAPDAAIAVRFGTSVEISNGRLLIGADGAQGGIGAVYVFDGAPGSYSFTNLLGNEAGTLQNGDQLGSTVAARDNQIIAGAPFADVGGNTNIGAAFAYDLSLTAEPEELSIAAGGSQTLFLNAGEDFAGQFYIVGFSLILASLPLSPSVTLPILPDPVFSASLNLANSPPFVNTFGVLDGNGQANAALAIAPGTAGGLVGQTLFSAFVVFDVFATPLFASNAEQVFFLP